MQAIDPGQQGQPVIPRPAATVVLLRDAKAGPEVYMLRRHEESGAFGGAYVFPGGKLDHADCEGEAIGRVGTTPDVLHAALREPGIDVATAAGLFYAACRETFEEARVLLARGPAASAGEQAWRMLREGMGFGEVLATHELELASDALVPWSRWITPRVPSALARNKRFDTRFFLTVLPEGQVAGVDEHEAVEGDWLAPREALLRYCNGEILMGPPQIMSLLQLTGFGSTGEILASARKRGPVLIEPEPFEMDGCRVVCYPGDENHPVREAVLTGPTRMLQRGKRFEPPGGIPALLKWAGC